ncbi:glycosyltransferase [Desulfoferula mesophila]|uniref:UDP-4-amino-4-deoxy-L-arabinose-oxoglutarate aminotransferase n=1 Tax=Desulfoferula mesophila TaxID=3058419 RepID=A0AAU9EZT2_9BACT|nr:UDP-4-amino-4-deoxy-L-arabinose-oxoglutarate aminotransferase [Desulfoferula mesophilus]
MPPAVTQNQPYLSVVIPVFNEEDNLVELHARLSVTLNASPWSWEVIYVDDGSKDASWELLCRIQGQDPHARLVRFNRNYGQHMAIFAGFEKVRGQVVVTLDADLQNPPEEVPKLVAKLEEGFDVVSGWRQERHDSVLRKIPTWLVAKVTSRVVGVQLKDYGCMLRAYRREVVDAMSASHESSSYIPALANLYASSVGEIPVAHAERAAGRSKYGILKLIKLNFDLMTGFSVLPIQMVSVLGVLIALVGLGFGLFLIIRRLVVGPEVEGVFTLFAILFVFVGLQILVVGLMGEYLGRIYREVRHRPRFVVRETRDSEAGS